MVMIAAVNPETFYSQRRQREVDEKQLDQQRRVSREFNVQRHQSVQVRRCGTPELLR